LTDDIKNRAEAQFKRKEEASEAMAEYKAEVEAERAKTERLRALLSFEQLDLSETTVCCLITTIRR
jgi:Mg2+/Co2+ transporter CorB